MIILTVVAYYRERRQIKINQGKSTYDRNPEETRAHFQEPVPGTVDVSTQERCAHERRAPEPWCPEF